MSRAFGQFFARIRRERLRLSLREFCARKGLDPGNMSKLERGKTPPPRSREVLEKYARALELEEGSDDWLLFFDLAAASRGELPADFATDEEILEKLPVLFRSLRGERVDEKKLNDLLELLRKA
ncbi:MAG: helix-turn-helix domain-containing protein [Gemmatimonadota bacterium]